MDELLDWLCLQKGGIRTYIEFQQRALRLSSTEPEHAALLRLLGDLAGRFVDEYDEQPLPVDVAERALARLASLVRQAARVTTSPPSEQITLLNEIGRAELSKVREPDVAGRFQLS